MPHRGGKKEPADHLDFTVDMAQMEMQWPEVPPPEFSLVRPDATQTYATQPYKYILEEVYDQGQVGCCVTNAVSSAYRYELQRQQKEKGQPLVDDFRPSRLFLYYVGRLTHKRHVKIQRRKWYAKLATKPPTEVIVEDYGCYNREVIKILGALGTTFEDDVSKHQDSSSPTGGWPYKSEDPIPKIDDDSFDTFPPESFPAKVPDKECFASAVKHMTLAYAKPMMDPLCWKKCIYAGHPVIFGFRDYANLSSELTPAQVQIRAKALKPTDDPRAKFLAPTPRKDDDHFGGHAVLAVGWSDKLEAFRIQNSWGEDWGDKGFFYMPYSWLNMDSPNPKDVDKTNTRLRMVYDAWTLKGSSELNHH